MGGLDAITAFLQAIANWIFGAGGRVLAVVIIAATALAIAAGSGHTHGLIKALFFIAIAFSAAWIVTQMI
jgi:type IV secretory pathway VirB2 component (pilin)